MFQVRRRLAPATVALPESAKTQRRAGIGLRAILIGFLLIIPNTCWIILIELVYDRAYPTILSLFMNVLFILLLLVGMNRVIPPRWRLSQGELLTIYIILNISTAMTGTDMVQVLVAIIPAATWYAAPENNWEHLFLDKMPDWLLIRDRKVLEGFFMGQSTLYTKANLLAWGKLTLAWMPLIVALLVAMLCLNALLRRRWSDKERLTYPITQLPLEITHPQSTLLTNRLMWLGFALTIGIDLLNGLHFLFPSVPALPMNLVDLGQMVKDKPWNAIGYTPLRLYMFVIGMGFLMPVDLIFSCWFFFLFHKTEQVVTSAMAWDANPKAPFLVEQCGGAFLGIAAFTLWNSRRYLRAVLRRALGLSGAPDDACEPMSYRTALIGLVLSLLALQAFSMKAGMSGWVVPFFFAIVFAIAITTARLRAELGSVVHDLPFMGAEHYLTQLGGTKIFTGADLRLFSIYYWFNRSYGSSPMPAQLEGIRMAERASIDQRRLSLVILMAGIAGAIACIWVSADVMYRLGANTARVPSSTCRGYIYETFNRLTSWLTTPENPNVPVIVAMGSACLATIGLLALRLRVLWMPFHPLGLAIAQSWIMMFIWASLFIAWIIKASLLRWGGKRAYQKALPFFFGLILGDCVAGSLWLIFGLIFNIRTYSVWNY